MGFTREETQMALRAPNAGRRPSITREFLRRNKATGGSSNQALDRDNRLSRSGSLGAGFWKRVECCLCGEAYSRSYSSSSSSSSLCMVPEAPQRCSRWMLMAERKKGMRRIGCLLGSMNQLDDEPRERLGATGSTYRSSGVGCEVELMV